MYAIIYTSAKIMPGSFRHLPSRGSSESTAFIVWPLLECLEFRLRDKFYWTHDVGP